ncbi:hypothetical protein [Mucilaginibacter sp. dw_454]|uniref:hypothetical protein n=1 Tax=Mucilaginibacter sp. dw_454 TaxID=2720079 RepID=UPI001BD1C380|nr:hypothetical protein [Mucilaginibacter sp. dw_454]
MSYVSTWTKAAAATFGDPDFPEAFNKQVGAFQFAGRLIADSFWIEVTWAKKGALSFRAAYAPGGSLKLKNINADSTELKLTSAIGDFKVDIDITDDAFPILHYTTSFKPSADILVPFWPRDILVPGQSNDPEKSNGDILVKQIGTRSGQLYFQLNKPEPVTVFYLQNLTALGDYCQETETSASDTVGGEWPDIGFALPPTIKGKPLTAGKRVIISDAFIAFDANLVKDEAVRTNQFLDMMAALYLALPKPDTNYKHWPDILDKGLKDLLHSPGCWSQVAGNHYFNAYFCDYVTPPEIMVQLAVLLPLIDYKEWHGSDLEAIDTIKKGLPAFYDEKLKTIMRWHPAVTDQLEGEEEQKEPMVMDSWYLHHPLLNLSRLALKGDKDAEKLFLNSIGFAIKVARHFGYQWPVFYKMDTLEVVKAETVPGKGGEKDVPGLYAHIMLQAWELTKDKKYLAEAEHAAKQLVGLEFDLFYQANNTAFSSGALLRLYKITGKEIYKELSYLCLANVFKNVRLWDIQYGYLKDHPSFFAVFPLNDAPYTAVYEEQEVFCAFHDYLHHAQGENILPSARLLLAEYIKYLVDRAPHYYPPMMAKDMLPEKPKIGALDPALWIALEDVQDGWEKSGQVGQEVYGAGNAFGILPRHYMQVADESFMIFCDYPMIGFAAKKRRPISFQLAGDGRLQGQIIMVKTDRKKLPEFTVTVKGSKEPIKGKPIVDGHVLYTVTGDQTVKIDW